MKPNEEFGFVVNYREFSELQFSIIGYKIWHEQVLYSVIVIPQNEYTSIDNSEKNISEMFQSRVLEEFIQWIDLIKEYKTLSPIDFKNLFQLEQDELFLQNEPNTFSKEDQILTYCLKSLSVVDFQGVRHAKIENLPVDTNWVLLVGENGFGKSTILQAIMLGLHGSKDGSYDYVQIKEAKISLIYKNENENITNNLRLNVNPLAHIAAYGPVRLNRQVDASESEMAQKSGTLYSLFRTDGVLLNIESELVIWHLKNDPRFKLIKKAFLKLLPNLADLRFNTTNNRIEYIEKDVIDGEEQYEPLPFEKIASGFRSILGMAGDIIIRLSNTQKDIENPSDLKGIVIIDELDLHWHPKFQKQIPELFSEVFPNIQFIVSTHSPIPLLGAPKNSVILKVSRTKEEGITIQKVDIDLKTLTPNLLLTSGVFDMDDIFSSQLGDDLTEVRTENTFEEMEENDEIDKYLKEFEKSNEQFPDELFEPKNK